MKKTTNTSIDRRRALALLGGSAAAVSLLGLAGCGSEDEAPRPELIKPDPEPTPPPTQTEPAGDTASDSDAAMKEAETPATSDTIASDAGDSGSKGGLPQVDESSAKARQLAYVHDASTVSASAQPRYAEGQQCGNCALYQGGSAEWGGCPLFSGQQVKRTGWCNAYAPRGA